MRVALRHRDRRVGTVRSHASMTTACGSGRCSGRWEIPPGRPRTTRRRTLAFEGLPSVALLEGLAPSGGRALEQAVFGPAGHQAQQVAQVCERFNLVKAAAGQERDEGGVHLCAVVAAHEEPVLPADDLPAQVQLADVVVQRQPAVIRATPPAGCARTRSPARWAIGRGPVRLPCGTRRRRRQR